MSLTFAQETDFNGDADFSEEEFRQKVDSVFQYIEYQGVDTGILIEHGFNFLTQEYSMDKTMSLSTFSLIFCKYFCLFANYNYFYAN